MKANIWLPLLVFITASTVTYQLWQEELRAAKKQNEKEFVYEAEKAGALISQNLLIYKQALMGVQSLFDASEFVARDEFHRYVNNVLIADKNIPVKNVGFIQYQPVKIPSPNLSSIDSSNNASINNSALHQDALAIQTYLEPDIESNAEKYGKNVFADANQKAALIEARDSGDIAVRLVPNLFSNLQINEQAGYVLYLPIYRKNKFSNNVLSRQKNIFGWVYFDISKYSLIQNSLGADQRNFNFDIYDIESEGGFQKHQISVAQHGAQYELIKHIHLMNRDFLYHIESTPEFEKMHNQSRSFLVAIAGVFATLTLTFLVLLLVYGQRSLESIRLMNNRLKESEQRWKFALEGAGDGVWDWDIKANTVSYSKRWKEMLGYDDAEISNNLLEWESRLHPDEVSEVKLRLHEYFVGDVDAYVNEFRMQCKDGSWKWMLGRGMFVSHDANGKPLRMVGTLTDISAIKESEEMVWQHANFDSLTGLPNRRMFYDRLEFEMRKTKRSNSKMALMFLDLDRFKEINDTLGHSQGDALLVDASVRLKASVRATDTVARLGGDEFIILLGDIDEVKLVDSVARKIINALQEPFKLAEEIVYISSSIGISLYPDDAVSVDDLMKNVDQAMYAAKKGGGGRYCYFTPSMQLLAQQRMTLANDLRGALERNEFFIVYQPIVNLKDGKIVKAEALIRWQHPIRGLIPPSEFIPIAEDIGLIIDIGNWVFEQAIMQVSLWRNKVCPDFQVSINKSPVQFKVDSVGKNLWYKHLSELGLSGSCMVIEITEGILLEANENVSKTLMEFRDAGIQVAIDDFGTGYSSLSYIKRFDIDYIKIDKSFVANLSADSDDLALCEAIVVMAHKLGLKVIAEGIETEVQKHFLKQAGCDFGQGYFFSQPLEANNFEALLNAI